MYEFLKNLHRRWMNKDLSVRREAAFKVKQTKWITGAGLHRVPGIYTTCCVELISHFGGSPSG